jgi:hypothetical protein
MLLVELLSNTGGSEPSLETDLYFGFGALGFPYQRWTHHTTRSIPKRTESSRNCRVGSRHLTRSHQQRGGSCLACVYALANTHLKLFLVSSVLRFFFPLLFFHSRLAISMAGKTTFFSAA